MEKARNEMNKTITNVFSEATEDMTEDEKNKFHKFLESELLKIKGKKSVDLIACGYEWICPSCETLNREIEVTEAVRCQECEQKFKINDHHHAVS